MKERLCVNTICTRPLASTLLVLLAGCTSTPRQHHSRFAAAAADSTALRKVLGADGVDVALLELAVFRETNVQRERVGIAPLKFDTRLQMAARDHSREMVALEYFDHQSPVADNGTIRKRLTRVGIRRGMVGENIAIHPVLQKQAVRFDRPQLQASRYGWRNHGRPYTYEKFARDLVNRWLSSVPHRNTIFNRNYKYLGVGCVPATFNDADVFYVTQNFSSTDF